MVLTARAYENETALLADVLTNRTYISNPIFLPLPLEGNGDPSLSLCRKIKERDEEPESFQGRVEGLAETKTLFSAGGSTWGVFPLVSVCMYCMDLSRSVRVMNRFVCWCMAPFSLSSLSD